MKTLSVQQMREADRRCIEELGVPGVVLMENAGCAVYQALHAGSVAVVCGKGNNGGDGFVVARWALAHGRDTLVVLVGDPDHLTPDARTFRDAYENLGGEIVVAGDTPAIEAAMRRIGHYDNIVDALLGTGIQGDVRGLAAEAIAAWPEGKGFTVAADLPSGLNADTGEVSGPCVRADLTVTFQFPKTGFAHPGAAPYIGRLEVADIGIPEICADDEAWDAMRNR